MNVKFNVKNQGLYYPLSFLSSPLVVVYKLLQFVPDFYENTCNIINLFDTTFNLTISFVYCL